MNGFIKKITAYAASAAMALVFVIGTPFGAVTALAETTADKAGQITVNGMGTIKTDPDIASISVGVEITRDDAADAQKENAEIIEKVKKALKDSGIDDKDVETSYYYINKVFDYTNYYMSYSSTPANTEPKVIGYSVKHQLNVTVRDLDKVGEILDAVTKAGANQVNGVNYSVEDPEAFYLKALEQAIVNAEKKAASIAKVLKVEIGAPSSIMENSNSYVYPIYMDSAVMKAETEYSAGGGTSINTGKIEVTAYVSVTYEYVR